jgi:hypothetical protein
LLGLGVAASLAGTRGALAYDVSVGLRTVGQGYQERRYDPRGGNEVLSRRRLTQYLTLAVDGLEPAEWASRADPARLNATATLRFDLDFGRYMTAAPQGRNAIGELGQNQMDVLEATISGRDLAGRLDFDLGRQIHLDALDFWAVDGLRLDFRLWRALRVELLGGTEVRGERPLSAPIFELDGTSAGDKDPATHAAQAAALRPTAGAALGWRDELSRWGGRLAYRRSWSATADESSYALGPLAGPVGVGPGSVPSTGVNAEHVSALLDFTSPFVVLEGGVRYNLLTALWDRHDVSFRIGRAHGRSLVLEESYLMPTFDGDSIWNVFAYGAFQDWRARYEMPVAAATTLALSAFARHYEGVGTTTGVVSWAYGGHAGLLSRRDGRGMARMDLVAEDGWGGRRLGLDVSGRRRLGPSTVDVEGRLTATTWRASPAQGTSGALAMAGAQLGARYAVTPSIQLHGLIEDNVGPYDRSNVRLLVVLDVRTAP